MSFHCPKCDGKTRVYETRVELRRRQCVACGHQFATEEIEYDGQWSYRERKRLTADQMRKMMRCFRRGTKVATVARSLGVTERTVYLHYARWCERAPWEHYSKVFAR